MPKPASEQPTPGRFNRPETPSDDHPPDAAPNPVDEAIGRIKQVESIAKARKHRLIETTAAMIINMLGHLKDVIEYELDCEY